MTQDVENQYVETQVETQVEDQYVEYEEKVCPAHFWLRLIVLGAIFIWFFCYYDTPPEDQTLYVIYACFILAQYAFHWCLGLEVDTPDARRSYTSLTTYAVPNYILLVGCKVHNTTSVESTTATSVILMVAWFFVAVVIGVFSIFLGNCDPRSLRYDVSSQAKDIVYYLIRGQVFCMGLLFLPEAVPCLQWVPNTFFGLHLLVVLIALGCSVRAVGFLRSNWIVTFGPYYQLCWLVILMLCKTTGPESVCGVSWYFVQGISLFFVANSCACWGTLARLSARSAKSEAIKNESEGTQIEEMVVEEV